MAHKTGAVFSTGHIPHGCANAIYLPYVIEFNAKNAEGRFADIAKAAGLTGASDAELTRELREKIDDYNVKLGIPKTLKDFGIKEDEFKEKRARIAALAVGDACTGANPRRVSPAEMEKLLDCVYYGRRVDF
jgi:alcohol dehydrogenase class IV